MAQRASFGLGGWVRVDDAVLPGPLYVRFQRHADDLRITEVYLDGRGTPLDSAMLDSIKLPNLEAWLAKETWEKEANWIEQHLDEPGPDLARLASYFNQPWLRAGNWIADSFYAQYPGSDIEQVPLGPEPKKVPAKKPPPLKPPTGRLTDDFLEQVARAYRYAASQGQRPSVAIREQLGPGYEDAQRTIQNWFYIARKRGIMPPGKPGRVG